jgi:hypothetical protein
LEEIMRFLRLPEGMASVTVFDQTYGENGIIRGPDGNGIEDHIAREIMAHDPRITEFVLGGPDDPEGSDNGDARHVAFMARIGALDRTELFAVARSMRVAMPATLKTDQMREIVVREAAKRDPSDLPLLVAGSMGGGDGVVMMPPEIAASPNRGNDGLGTQIAKHGSTGSTFTQANFAGAPEPAKPAPSGAGTLTPAGTTQPPYNQLNTETGQASHDSKLAPFPISVAPINPDTGQPYEAGDPRIPATSRPIARAPDDAYHAVVDDHEHKAADAIEVAAADLDLALSK